MNFVVGLELVMGMLPGGAFGLRTPIMGTACG